MDFGEIEEISKETVIEYPDWVEDKEAYRKYLSYKKVLDDHNEDIRTYQTSDPDIILNMYAPKYTIEKKIKSLPTREQEKILDWKKKILKVHGKANGLKGVAKGNLKNIKRTSKIHELDALSREAIVLMGRYYSLSELKEYFLSKHKLRVTDKLLRDFREKHKDAIDELRIKFTQDDGSSERLFHKKGRLEMMRDMVRIMYRKFLDTESPSAYDRVLKTLEQFRKEAENPNLLRVEGSIKHIVEHQLNLHVQQEIFGKMSITDIIIGRVAAQQKVKASYIIERLHNSFYSKHSGFRQSDIGAENENVIYPSSIVYNWQMINDKHTEQANEERKQVMEIKPYTDPELIDQAALFKKGLQQKLDEMEQNDYKKP